MLNLVCWWILLYCSYDHFHLRYSHEFLMNKLSTATELWELDRMIRCGPNEIENETDMKVADSLTTWRSQRAREAICRKSAQTFHLPLVKYEDEYSLCDCKSLSLYFGRKLRNWILEENSWVWKIWTEEEWEVEVKIWTTLTYHKVEWGYRSESDKIMLRKINKVVMYLR